MHTRPVLPAAPLTPSHALYSHPHIRRRRRLCASPPPIRIRPASHLRKRKARVFWKAASCAHHPFQPRGPHCVGPCHGHARLLTRCWPHDPIRSSRRRIHKPKQVPRGTAAQPALIVRRALDQRRVGREEPLAAVWVEQPPVPRALPAARDQHRQQDGKNGNRNGMQTRVVR